MTSPRVEFLTARGCFRAYASRWEAIAARSGQRGPFYLPGWFAIYAAHDRVRALRLLVAERGHELCAVLPLWQERRRIGGLRVAVLRSLSDDHSQRFDLVAEDDLSVEALWRCLAADPTWDVLELRDLPLEGARATRLFECAAADGFPTGDWPSQRSPFLPLPSTADELLAGLPAKFRANLLRRRRRAEAELGRIELERVAGQQGLDEALDEGFTLEATGWKGRAGTAIAQHALLEARYRALARHFAHRQELAIHFLRLGERRVAFHFAIERGGVYHLLKPGFDVALGRFGLGHLLVAEVAKSLIARRFHEVDFLGDDMPWKREWTSRVRPQVWRYVFRPTPFGRGLHAWKFKTLPALRRTLGRARAAEDT